MIQEITQKTLDGEINPLDALVKLKDLKKEIEQAIKEVEPISFEEAEKYGEKTFAYNGCIFEIRKGGKMYDYKGVPEWVKAKQALKDIENKSLQALKSYESGLMTATQDGEEVVLPKVTFRKDSIVIKKT